MTVLFITEIIPFPVNSGERIRTYGLLKIMSDLDLKVLAVVGKAKKGNNDFQSIKGVDYFPYDFYDKNFFNGDSMLYNLRIDKEFIKYVSKILDNNQVDFVFIDFRYRGQYIQFFRKKGYPVIYGTHNAQATIIRHKPVHNFKGRISRYLQYLVNRFHEHKYFKNADALIVVSDGDYNYHASFVNRSKIHIIPNFLIESDYFKIQVPKEDNLIMTANFRAYQNFFGLEWFVKEVWDVELAGIFKLLLVGRDSKDAFEKLSKEYSMKNIIAIGEVDDIKPYIARARASLVPLLHGSGSRLKCLESMALKTILISTTKGAEGIEHDNSIIIADTPTAFKNSLLNLSDQKSVNPEKAFSIFVNKYSLEPNKKIFEGIIKNITLD